MKITLKLEDERMIEHWALIAKTVFAAEDAIKHDWLPKLRKAKDATPEERKKIADEYCRAIAKEILSHAEEKES